MRSTFVLLILGAAVACGDSNNSTPDAPKHPDANNDAAGDAAADATPDAAPDAGPDAAPDAATDAGPDAPNDGGMAPMSRVWAVGDFATNGTTQAGWFTDGDTLPATPATVPAAPAVLPTSSGYTDFVFDATPTKTAYVADVTTAGTFDLYAADADGTNPTLLVAVQTGVEIATVALSPDGTKAAFMMDSTALNGAYDVWVVNTAGTPVPVLVSPTRNVLAPDLTKLSAFTGSLTWSSDSKFIGFSGDFTTDGHSQAYEVDTTAATPAAIEMLADADLSGTSAGVRGDVLFDGNDKAYFRAGLTDTTTFTFFQWDGTQRTALALPMRGDNTTANVGAFGFSPDGATIVFSADAPLATAYDLYVTPVATWNPVRITAATLAGTNPPHNLAPQFSPDGTQVAFVADYITDNVTEAFVAPIDGSGMRRVANFTVGSTDAVQVHWTADGTALYVLGDLAVNNDTTLFRLDPTMTDGAATQAITVPTSGDVFNSLVRAK
jgi:Tol biopolymer transport system component